VTQFVGRFSESLSAAKQALQVAQQRQEARTDKHRSPHSFAVGDQVLLSSRNTKLEKAPAGARKLIPNWLGPFPVVDKVGTVACRLELPASMRVHPVFHVSFLKPFHRDSDEGRERPPPPPVVIDGEEAERLLDAERTKLSVCSMWGKSEGVEAIARNFSWNSLDMAMSTTPGSRWLRWMRTARRTLIGFGLASGDFLQ
jgi:hypothetical protein